MKKGLKITLITLGTVVGIGAAAFLTLGGLPLKIAAEKNFPALNVTASEYPYAAETAPADFTVIERDGVSLKAPAGMHAKDDSDPDRPASRIFVSDTDETLSVFILEPYDFGELDLTDETYNLDNERLSEFSTSIGRLPLTDWYSFYDLMYHMTADDCSTHSFRKAYSFYVLGYVKEEILPGYLEYWDWQTDDGAGFVYLKRTPETDIEPRRYQILAELFSNDDRNTAYDVIISASDLETCCQIANSIKLTG